MATVTFEPTTYSATVVPKTAFFTDYTSGKALAVADSATIAAFAFSEQYPLEPSVADTATIRSYEIYIDKTSDATNEVVQSLANVTTDIDNTTADLYLSVAPSTGTTVASSTFTVKNLTGDIVDVVIVLVTDEA